MAMDHAQQLQKSRYRLWVKAGLALKYLKDGIENFVDDEIISQHRTILEELGLSDVSCDECNIDTLLPAHDRAGCVQGNRCFCRDPKHKRRPCPKDVCGRILDKIVLHHMHGRPCWSNTDATKWCESHWEIAKCFLDGGGYADKMSASDTDCKGLLSIITNNMFVQKSVDTPIDKIEPKTDVFSKTKDARNEILHLASLELSDEQFKSYVRVMLQLLEDKGNLKNYDPAKQAITKLKQLEQKNLVISTEDEWEVRESALKAIQEKKQQALDEIDERKAQKENFEKLQTQIVQMQETLSALSNTSAESTSSLSSSQEVLGNRVSLLESTMKQMQQVQLETPKEILDLQKDMSELKSRLDASNIIETLHKEKLTYLKHKKELRNELISLYSKYLSTITVSPLLKRLDASVDDFYMELEIVHDLVYERHENKRSGDIIKHYRDIFYKANLTKEKEVEKRKEKTRVENIYVLGDAGAGKSTWCLKLINMWLQGQTENDTMLSKEFTPNEKMMHEFDVVFFIALRHASLETDLIEMIGNQIFDQSPRLLDYSKSVLMEEPEKCLVIVDGLDEWNTPGVNVSSPFGKTSKLPGRKDLNHCTVLTTSRPWKLNEVKPSYQDVDRAVIIRGFERESSIRILAGKVIDKLVELDSQPDACSNKSKCKQVEDFECEVKILFNMTASNSDYPDLMKIPLILIFMVLRWFKDGALERTMAGNYLSLIENILDHEEGYQSSKSKYGQSSDYDGRLSRIPNIGQAKTEWSTKIYLLPECIKKRTMCAQYCGILLKLSKIAFDGLFDGQGNQLIFNEEIILEKITPRELEVSVKSGILSKTSIVGGSSYDLSKLSFLHKTVQEYFAALHIITDVKNGENIAMQKFEEVCSTYSKIYEMENVIMFVCGLESNLAGRVLNHISSVEKSRMSFNKYDQISTHFYYKCFKEVIDESGDTLPKLPLNSFVLEQLHHATDFLELLKASDDKISYGKIGLFYEPEIGQPRLMDYFLSRTFATSLTTLELESITLECSKDVKLFELDNLKNLMIASLECKCAETDVDKEVRCCVNMDFSNSINIETANIYNISKCKVILSGSRLLELRLEYLMLCDIQVYVDITGQEKENHTATKETISISSNIDLIDIKQCQLSKLACQYRSYEQACQLVNVSTLNCKGIKKCKLEIDKNIGIEKVSLVEIDNFPKLTWQKVYHLHIKLEENDSSDRDINNTLANLTFPWNLAHLNVDGFTKNCCLDLVRENKSCFIECLEVTFCEFIHYFQTETFIIQDIKHLTLYGTNFCTKTQKSVYNATNNKPTVESDDAKIQLVSKQPPNFENLRRLTCNGLTECDFVSLGQWFSSLPLLKELELSHLIWDIKTTSAFSCLENIIGLKVLSLSCLSNSVWINIVNFLSNMSNLNVTDLLFEQCPINPSDYKCALLREQERILHLAIDSFLNMKLLERLTIKNFEYLALKNVPFLTNGKNIWKSKTICSLTGQNICQTNALIAFTLYGYCFDEHNWLTLVKHFPDNLQTVKLLNTTIVGEGTENVIKSSAVFKYQNWECVGRKKYNITVKKDK